MPKRPSPPQPAPLLSWEIYKAASKAKWIGTIEAADEGDAIEKAAKQLSVPWNGAERAQH